MEEDSNRWQSIGIYMEKKNNPYKFPEDLVITHPCIVKDKKYKIVEGILMDDEFTQ